MILIWNLKALRPNFKTEFEFVQINILEESAVLWA